MVKPHIKGKNFEREIAKDLGNRFNANVRRTPNSGGIEGFMRQDIICLDPDSILNEFFMELKKQESLNCHKVYWRTKGLSPANKKPIVIWKKNNDPEPIVAIGYDDFCNLLEIIEEYKNLLKETKEMM